MAYPQFAPKLGGDKPFASVSIHHSSIIGPAPSAPRRIGVEIRTRATPLVAVLELRGRDKLWPAHGHSGANEADDRH